MLRRTFVAMLVLLATGCERHSRRNRKLPGSQSKPMQVATSVNYEKGIYGSTEEAEFAGRIRDKILEHLPERTDGAKTFDPLTIITIVGFVIRLIQVCQAASISHQQAACKSKPNGAVAKHLKKKLHERYMADHPTADAEDVEQHVDASLKAFTAATPEEISEVKDNADRFNNRPTETDLFDFTGELSRRDL